MPVSDFFNLSDVGLTCLNGAFFAVVQSLFFYFIAQNHYKVIIGQKMHFLVDIVDSLPWPLAKKACEVLTEDRPADHGMCRGKNIRTEACDAMRKEDKDQQNRKNLWAYSSTFVASLLGTAAVCFALSAWPTQAKGLPSWLQKPKVLQPYATWQKSQWWSVAMILGCFATELLFFFGFFSQYEVYGDLQILSKVVPAPDPAVAEAEKM